MSRAVVGPMLKIMAALLLALIVWRALIVGDYLAVDMMLARLDRSDSNSAGVRLAMLDEVAARRKSDRQESRFQDLRAAFARELVLEAAALVWPDDARLPLAQAVGRPLGAPPQGRVRLEIDRKALAGRELRSVVMDGRKLELAARDWELPFRLDAENPNAQVTIALAIGEDVAQEIRLAFLRDRNPPQIELTTAKRGPIEPEGDVIGLDDGEILALRLQNGTLMRRVRITLDGETVLDRANERVLDDRIEFAGAPASLVVEARDWSGNLLSRSFELRPLEPEAPRLAKATLGPFDLLTGRRYWRETTGTIALEVAGRTRQGAVEVVIDGFSDYETTRRSENSVAVAFRFAGEGEILRGRVLMERYGKALELGAFEIVHDASAPFIDLENGGEPYPYDNIRIDGEAHLVLRVRDAALDAARIEARRSGAVRLGPTRSEDGAYVRDVTVAGSGGLEVAAFDLAGNERRRDFVFAPALELGPADGEGPRVELVCGEQVLDPAHPAFFWNAARDVELRIADPAGIDPTSLRPTNIRPEEAWPTKAVPRFDSPVELGDDPTLELKDLHGAATQVVWRVTIVTGPARIDLDEEARRITSLPVTIGWSLASELPADAWRCRLLGPDGAESLPQTAGRRLEIGAADLPTNGAWRLVVELLTPLGPVEMAAADLEVELAR